MFGRVEEMRRSRDVRVCAEGHTRPPKMDGLKKELRYKVGREQDAHGARRLGTG